MPISSSTFKPAAYRATEQDKKLVLTLRKKEAAERHACDQQISALGCLIKAYDRVERAPERGIRRKFADMMLAIAKVWKQFTFSRHQKAWKKLSSARQKLENARETLQRKPVE